MFGLWTVQTDKEGMAGWQRHTETGVTWTFTASTEQSGTDNSHWSLIMTTTMNTNGL